MSAAFQSNFRLRPPMSNGKGNRFLPARLSRSQRKTVGAEMLKILQTSVSWYNFGSLINKPHCVAQRKIRMFPALKIRYMVNPMTNHGDLPRLHTNLNASQRMKFLPTLSTWVMRVVWVRKTKRKPRFRGGIVT